MQTIRIGEKHYNAETLTDNAKALLGDLQKIEGRMGQLSLDLSIMDVAKNTLIGKLMEESTNLEEVHIPEGAPTSPEQTDAPAGAAEAPKTEG